MKFTQAELSVGAKALFERLLPQAVLFHMPNPDPQATPGLVSITDSNLATDNFSYNGNKVLIAALDWCENGILPYPLTATTFDWKHSSGANRYNETTIAWLTKGYTLNYVYRLDIVDHQVDPGEHTILYGCFVLRNRQDADLSSVLGLRLPDPKYQNFNGRAADGSVGTYKEWVKSEGVCSMFRLIQLFHALESVEHTATERKLTRQEARATGQPRTQWTIRIRKRGSRGIPSMREQFAQVVKAAHAVRAHHRSEHLRGYKSKTGEQKVAVVRGSKVRAHIRGQGGAVQFKDYLVEA